MTNIAEILKNAPQGLKLYSLVHGKVTLEEVINSDINYPIVVIDCDNVNETYSKDGKFVNNFDDAECVLYPSKEHKSWDNWQNVLFKVGDIVTRVIDEIPTSFIITSINKKDDKLEVIDKTGSTKTLNYICLTEYATPEFRIQQGFEPKTMTVDKNIEYILMFGNEKYNIEVGDSFSIVYYFVRKALASLEPYDKIEEYERLHKHKEFEELQGCFKYTRTN